MLALFLIILVIIDLFVFLCLWSCIGTELQRRRGNWWIQQVRLASRDFPNPESREIPGNFTSQIPGNSWLKSREIGKCYFLPFVQGLVLPFSLHDWKMDRNTFWLVWISYNGFLSLMRCTSNTNNSLIIGPYHYLKISYNEKIVKLVRIPWINLRFPWLLNI